jgi:hypothetical protein
MKKLIGLASLILFLSGCSPMSEETKYFMSTGERGRLVSDNSKKIRIGESYKDLLECEKALIDKNDAVLYELVSSNRIGLLPPGTRVEVVDSEQMISGKAKVLDGSHREGWVWFKQIDPDTPRR